MKAGVIYPQVELGGDTGAVKAFAQAAEELGYDHIVIYDHVLGAVHAGREPKLTGPYKETDPFHEPLITYAYLAGVTKNLELMTGVIILPQRQTALFAKQAADVDLFSDGRLRLGVGVGWNWVEFDGLEMSRHFRRRGKRQEHQIALIRKLWEQPVVECGFRPPDRPGRYLAAAETADPDLAGRVQRGRVRPGRQDRRRFLVFRPDSNRSSQNQGADRNQTAQARQECWRIRLRVDPAIRSRRQPMARRYRGMREAGGSHISVVTMGANLNTVDRHIAAIERWRDVYNSVR